MNRASKKARKDKARAEKKYQRTLRNRELRRARMADDKLIAETEEALRPKPPKSDVDKLSLEEIYSKMGGLKAFQIADYSTIERMLFAVYEKQETVDPDQALKVTHAKARSLTGRQIAKIINFGRV